MLYKNTLKLALIGIIYSVYFVKDKIIKRKI